MDVFSVDVGTDRLHVELEAGRVEAVTIVQHVERHDVPGADIWVHDELGHDVRVAQWNGEALRAVEGLVPLRDAELIVLEDAMRLLERGW
jgi:hypothetical protein